MYKKMNNELKVIGLYLGDYNQELYLRQIKELTGMSVGTTQNTLNKLQKEGILKAKTKGKNKYFSLNRDNANTKNHIIQAEIEKTVIFVDKNPLFKPFIKELPNDPILIFGSFATGKAKKDSDADILIIGKRKLPKHLLPFKVHEIRITKNLKKTMQEDILKEIREKHVILNDHLFFVNQWENG